MSLFTIFFIAILSITANVNAQGSSCTNQKTQTDKELCDALGKLNGHWYSEKWKYGYELTYGVGVATTSNSSNFKVGDKIIRLIPTGSNTFSGEQVYTDGKFYKIDVKLGTDGSLVFAGEKNISWVMTRTASNNSAGTKPQPPTSNQPVAPPTQSAGNNSTNIAVSSTPPATAVSTQPSARQPTDAQSYCEKVRTSAVADQISKKYVVIRGKLSELFELSGKNANDPALRQFISQTHRAFLLGLDDDSRSKTKVLLKRLNDAVPKKDAYNQDVALLQYIPWFAACADRLKDSALKFIFLDPSDNKSLNAFYTSGASARNTKLQELWDGPNLGGLYDRRIQDKTGLAPLGINPFWVTPLLFLSADNTLSAEATEAGKRLDALIIQLDTRITTLKTDLQSFANPNTQSAPLSSDQTRPSPLPPTTVASFSDYCRRLTTNPNVKQLLTELDAEGKVSVLLPHTYLDNKNRDLEKWVAQQIANLKSPTDFEDYRKGLRWINMCLIQQRNTPLFLLAFASRNVPQGHTDWYEKHLEKANLAAAALSAPPTQASGRTSSSQMESKFEAINPSEKYEDLKRSGSAHPREATLLAFLFPGAEEMVKKTAVGAVTAKELNDERKALAAKREAARVAEEDAKFIPLRRLVAFSKNKEISSAFQVCIRSEAKYFEGILKQGEALAKNAATVKEQQDIKSTLSNLREIIPVGIDAFCLYRLNVAMLVAEWGADRVRITSELSLVALLKHDTSDLNAKYTKTAVDAIQKHLQVSPESYRKERNLPSDYAFTSLVPLSFLGQLTDQNGKFGYPPLK